MISPCEETICGFAVLPLPEKPDYLPISDEEFRQNTLSAWCNGGEREKITAALRGGPCEWTALYRDESFLVRGAVMCKASEDIQLKMVHEPEPVVRKLLAQYGTDRVRAALLAERDSSPEVLGEIAKYGNVYIKNRVLPLAWDKPDTLKKIAPYLGSRGLRLLEKHPDPSVRFAAAMHGSRAQCRRFLENIKGKTDIEVWGMEDALKERLVELEKVKNILSGGFTRTIKYAEMER